MLNRGKLASLEKNNQIQLEREEMQAKTVKITDEEPVNISFRDKQELKSIEKDRLMQPIMVETKGEVLGQAVTERLEKKEIEDRRIREDFVEMERELKLGKEWLDAAMEKEKIDAAFNYHYFGDIDEAMSEVEDSFDEVSGIEFETEGEDDNQHDILIEENTEKVSNTSTKNVSLTQLLINMQIQDKLLNQSKDQQASFSPSNENEIKVALTIKKS